MGVKAGGVPRPCFSSHPNLPPLGGKGAKAQGGEEKIEPYVALVLVGCSTVSLIAREPMHFVLHFENAAHNSSKNLDVHC